MRVVMIDPGAFTPFHDDALCRALAAEACDVRLVTAPFVYHPWPEAVGYERRELFAGGAGASRGSRTLRRVYRSLSYPLAWRKLLAELARRPPAIVHLQWSLLPAVERMGLRRLRAAGVKVVQTLHNPRRHGGERTFSPVGASTTSASALRGEADALVVLAQAGREALLEDHPELASRVRVIPPGITVSATAAASATSGRRGEREVGDELDRESARARLGLEADAPVALFLGLIRPYKGLDLLLAAFAQVLRDLPAARLVVAGLPRPSFRPYARQMERLGLGERVRTDLRYLPQTAMDDYLAAADLVVLPYRDASQSGVLGAALAVDRAVVASAAGGIPEMLAESAGEMLVPAGDVSALAGAMTRLLADRDRAAELGRLAGRSARARFSWSRCAASTAALYRELAGTQ